MFYGDEFSLVLTAALTFLHIPRLESVSSTEELSDVYAHFTLYYGKDLVAMRNRQVGKAAVDDLDLDASLEESQVMFQSVFVDHRYT